MIKPEIWTDEEFVECSSSARLLFIGTWNFADDNGILPAKAKQLKMKILPADDVNIDDLLSELIERKMLILYTSGSTEYLFIRGFPRHQRLDRPTFNHPIPDDETLAKYGYFVEDSSRGRRILVEDSTKERKGKEENRKEKKELKEFDQKNNSLNKSQGIKHYQAPCPAPLPQDDHVFMEFWDWLHGREKEPLKDEEGQAQPYFQEIKIRHSDSSKIDEIYNCVTNWLDEGQGYEFIYNTWFKFFYMNYFNKDDRKGEVYLSSFLKIMRSPALVADIIGKPEEALINEHKRHFATYNKRAEYATK